MKTIRRATLALLIAAVALAAAGAGAPQQPTAVAYGPHADPCGVHLAPPSLA